MSDDAAPSPIAAPLTDDTHLTWRRHTSSSTHRGDVVEHKGMGSRNGNGKIVYKLVLTGGPCGGKTTGQDRLATFFESLGWKVYRVPETATLLINGGVKFAELSVEEATRFQENLLKTMMRLEDTFNELAGTCNRDCLVIYDRGTMDPSAYIPKDEWNKILSRNGLNEIELRDIRYNQVVHMLTAADGALDFYTLTNNTARGEGVKEAVERDAKTREAWVGFPYFDVVDNADTDKFDDKILKLIQIVCDRVGIEVGDRLQPNSKKRKFLVSSYDVDKLPIQQSFDVIHDFLMSEEGVQRRIRRRGQNGRYSYTSTMRRIVSGQPVETKMQITKREYDSFVTHHDANRVSIPKTRRCFNFGQQYYQLDDYKLPLPPHCPHTDRLYILETFTTQTGDELNLPSHCMRVEKEITGDPSYSMYNMALKRKPSQELDLASSTALTPPMPIDHTVDCPPPHERLLNDVYGSSC